MATKMSEAERAAKTAQAAARAAAKAAEKAQAAATELTEMAAKEERERQNAAATSHFVLNGMMSYGPVTVDGRRQRLHKGVLYPMEDTPDVLAMLRTGVARMATAEDVRRAQRTHGEGSITKAMLGGIGIKHD